MNQSRGAGRLWDGKSTPATRLSRMLSDLKSAGALPKRHDDGNETSPNCICDYYISGGAFLVVRLALRLEQTSDGHRATRGDDCNAADRFGAIA